MRVELVETMFPSPSQNVSVNQANALIHTSIESDGNRTLAKLKEILDQKLLSARFQPIIQMKDGTILGYEGLIRGPSDSPLHSPLNLFKAAWEHNLTVQVEHLCRRVVLETFQALNLPGKLFLNVSPECLLQKDAKHGETLDYIHTLGINPDRVIIELTEYQPCHDYALLKEAVHHYRTMGFEIAIDDLGEGFSSLRLWSELKPEYVKIDMHFIQGINTDDVKMQFVRSIQSIAEKSGSRVIAEGIETQEELLAVRRLGVAFGQGYHIAKPNSNPDITVSAEIVNTLSQKNRSQHSRAMNYSQEIKIRSLLKTPKTINSKTLNKDVIDLFLAEPQLKIIPVVDNGFPIGILNRHTVVDLFARPYQRELCGNKPCEIYVDTNSLIVEQDTSLQQVSHMIVEADPDHLINGMIIVNNGVYAGIATGPDLMRAITKMQINTAQYANPLTLLPGNVPINEQINLWLHKKNKFVVCYCDLDNFKPFNDVYGYQRGDEVIQMTSRVLMENCHSEHDFIGHIGGDDFIILFRSEDWEARCQNLLTDFAQSIKQFYSHKDCELGGYIGENRQGAKVFHPMISISLGAIRANEEAHFSHHQISIEAAEAKKQAKKMHGNSFFIDRRNVETT
jgi:diguanylate cyclase (GGDEF)-like protein